MSTANIKINKPLIVLLGLILIGFIVYISGPIYIVDEGQQSVTTRFGEIVGVETEAGLKFKIPFIDQVTRYSKKILSWDGEPRRVPTQEQQFIWVDTTARWRIFDPKLFYSSINTLTQAFSRLDDIIESSVRTTISQNKLVEAVRNTNNITTNQFETTFSAFALDDDDDTNIDEIANLTTQREQQPKIDKGRQALSQEMLDIVQVITPQFGIEVIDVVIRQIRYSDDLTESVYNRMISERKQIAQASRSWGEGRKQKILGQLENEQKVILSEAYATSETLKGTADAQATQIYANAYKTDPRFFSFWIAIESYRKTLPKLNKVLSTDYDYFRYLYNSQGTR